MWAGPQPTTTHPPRATAPGGHQGAAAAQRSPPLSAQSGMVPSAAGLASSGMVDHGTLPMGSTWGPTSLPVSCGGLTSPALSRRDSPLRHEIHNPCPNIMWFAEEEGGDGAFSRRQASKGVGGCRPGCKVCEPLEARREHINTNPSKPGPFSGSTRL